MLMTWFNKQLDTVPASYSIMAFQKDDLSISTTSAMTL
uniref:Uncharacterized protein n=1 Tax=Rhizophora mucronata TaxID=61149 RepID=A0A2P2N034_RHIMU